MLGPTRGTANASSPNQQSRTIYWDTVPRFTRPPRRRDGPRPAGRGPRGAAPDGRVWPRPTAVFGQLAIFKQKSGESAGGGGAASDGLGPVPPDPQCPLRFRLRPRMPRVHASGHVGRRLGVLPGGHDVGGPAQAQSSRSRSSPRPSGRRRAGSIWSRTRSDQGVESGSVYTRPWVPDSERALYLSALTGQSNVGGGGLPGVSWCGRDCRVRVAGQRIAGRGPGLRGACRCGRGGGLRLSGPASLRESECLAARRQTCPFGRRPGRRGRESPGLFAGMLCPHVDRPGGGR